MPPEERGSGQAAGTGVGVDSDLGSGFSGRACFEKRAQGAVALPPKAAFIAPEAQEVIKPHGQGGVPEGTAGMQVCQFGLDPPHQLGRLFKPYRGKKGALNVQPRSVASCAQFLQIFGECRQRWGQLVPCELTGPEQAMLQ